MNFFNVVSTGLRRKLLRGYLPLVIRVRDGTDPFGTRKGDTKGPCEKKRCHRVFTCVLACIHEASIEMYVAAYIECSKVSRRMIFVKYLSMLTVGVHVILSVHNWWNVSRNALRETLFSYTYHTLYISRTAMKRLRIICTRAKLSCMHALAYIRCSCQCIVPPC